MNPDQPVQGDYGYDMAHEDMTGGAGTAEPGRRRAPDPDPAHPDRTADTPEADGDLNYDEAHGF